MSLLYFAGKVVYMILIAMGAMVGFWVVVLPVLGIARLFDGEDPTDE